MTTNEAALSSAPKSEQRAQQTEELFWLLSERIARYTMGDSSSVPVETAQRLLAGIVYCVNLSNTHPSAESTAIAALRARREAGVTEAKRLAKRAKLLLMEAQRMQPPVTNRAFCDSLVALPVFFRAYDPDFFPQELPCQLDYPLCHPVSDALSGVEYLLDYLRRWRIESAFLRAFSRDMLIPLYERYYGDYDDLHVNLYLPVSEMAALCVLAGKPVSGLSLSQFELAGVEEILLREEETAREELLRAADGALAELRICGAAERAYLRETALDFLVRFRAAYCDRTVK